MEWVIVIGYTFLSVVIGNLNHQLLAAHCRRGCFNSSNVSPSWNDAADRWSGDNHSCRHDTWIALGYALWPLSLAYTLSLWAFSLQPLQNWHELRLNQVKRQQALVLARIEFQVRRAELEAKRQQMATQVEPPAQ